MRKITREEFNALPLAKTSAPAEIMDTLITLEIGEGMIITRLELI